MKVPGRKGLNPLSKKASGIAYDNQGNDFISVIYRGAAFPEINGQTFNVPKLNGSGRAQREYIEKQHRETLEEQDARTAAQEARSALAENKQELKKLRTQVSRLREEQLQTIGLVLAAAGVDRDRAIASLDAALSSGEISLQLTTDEISHYLTRVAKDSQQESSESAS